MVNLATHLGCEQRYLRDSGNLMSKLGQGSGNGLGKSTNGLSKVSSGLVSILETAAWEEANAWNDNGSKLVHEGDWEAGMALLSQSAHFGMPWALSSFTWFCLKSGDYSRGIDEFDECIQACEKVVAQLKNELKNDSRYSAFAPLQLANARSNTALLKLASGGSFQEARATWEQGADTGHTESQFYPALVAEKQGHPKEADEIVRALTTAAWFDARETLNEGILEGGWFKEWCAAGLIVLERNAPEVSVLAIPELNVQSLMDLPCVSTENLKDGIWEAVRLAVGLDPTAETNLRIFADAGDATSWVARSELGCLLSNPQHRTAAFEEGQQLLVLCLSAPYRDIVATAAWNLAESFKAEGRIESVAELKSAALALGEGTALRTTAERFLAEGKDEDAFELFERAVAELPRGDLNRVAARAQIALRACPGIPEDLAVWFRAHQGALSATDWDKWAQIALWSGTFNVDVARAAIATTYFEDCAAQCFYELAPYECGDCGRGVSSIAHVASGKGDGGYFVFKLLGPVDSEEIEEVGVFVPFMEDDIQELEVIGKGGQFLDIIGSAAPLVIGTLTCEGELIIADSSKSLDDREVSVCVEMPNDDYVVICWLRPEWDAQAAFLAQLHPEMATADSLVSVAVSAIRGPLAEKLLSVCPEMDATTRKEFFDQLWGDEQRRVNALLADIRPTVLAHMMETSGSEEVPNSFILQLAERETDADDAIYALQNSDAHGSIEILERLGQRGFVEPKLAWWQDSLSKNPDDIWARVKQARSSDPFESGDISSESVWARRAVARRNDISAETVRILSQDPDTRVRMNLAANASIDGPLLADLSKDNERSIVSAVAANSNTAVGLLGEMATRPRSPKGALAANPNTPASMLHLIVDDSTSAVRVAIAERADIPSDLAERLATDRSSVRCALATNPCTPESVLAALSQDENAQVRTDVAENPSSSSQTLTALSVDLEESVRDAVMANPFTPDLAKAQASLLGARASEVSENVELDVSPLSASISMPVLSRAKFCPECGVEIAENYKFCSGCGAPAPAPTSTIRDAGQWSSLQANWEIRGNFNVEGGSASFGTRIFEWCDCLGEIHNGLYCEVCGRGAKNCISVTSGSGDGVYPVFRLLDTEEKATGALALFEAQWATGIEDKSKKPAELVSLAQPVLIGTLIVDGLIYASDATAGWDCDYALVDIELPRGEYAVIAWRAEMEILKEQDMPPFTRQIAMGIYSTSLFDALEVLVPADRSKATRELTTAFGDEINQVLAHKEPQWGKACLFNASEDADRGEVDRSNSWLLQAAKHGYVPAENALPVNYLESTAPLDVARRARLLLMRGQRSGEPTRHSSTIVPDNSPQPPGNSGLTKSAPGLGGEGL